MSPTSLRATAIEAKSYLAEGRRQIQTRHEAGGTGLEVGGLLTDLTDSVVLRLLHSAIQSVRTRPGAANRDETAAGEDSTPTPDLSALSGSECDYALVALGGYGRRDLAPYSDIDLMFLIQPHADESVKPIVTRLSQDLYDAGLQLGLSVRDTREACQLAIGDAAIFTSLAEARYLAGSTQLFEAFRERFSRVTQRRGFALLELSLAARREERSKYGETVYLLCPNVKRSRGGLRDLHLIRWIAFARFGETDFDRIHAQHALSQSDLENILASREFLHRVRNEMHFHAGKSQDLLTRDEQVRIARKFGYEGDEGVLPVEQFMRDYFAHSSQVRYIAANFTQTARSRFGLRDIVGPVFSFSVGGDFRVGPVHVTATRQGLEKLRTSMVDVLRLMDLANAYNRRIDHGTWMAIREAMTKETDFEMSLGVAQRFMAFLGETSRLGPLLRRMHELRVLEKIIPPMKRARCLLQFNEYHKYTVDEHSIRAIEAAVALNSEESDLGEIYRGLKSPRLLHLALLMHDLGKGDKRDHSELGEELTRETCHRLMLDPPDVELVSYLVRHHLRMSHLAFYRDMSDDAVIAEFAASVQSVETLKMLYVLTCSDLAAVGPDVLNDWKKGLLQELYIRTLNQLTGKANRDPLQSVADKTRQDILQFLGESAERDEIKEAMQRLPAAFYGQQAAATLLKRLRQWLSVTADEPVVTARSLNGSQTIEFVIAAIDRPHSGIFHRITGTLTSARMEILSVDATELRTHRILNRFLVRDLDPHGEEQPKRLERLCGKIVQVLQDGADASPAFRSVWQPAQSTLKTNRHKLPTRVRIDNDTSESFTIIDVFAHDRLGLLYAISRAIFDLGLEVHYAKIGTYLDQVVDVFYVTDEEGEKVIEADKIEAISSELTHTVEADTQNR